MVNTMGLDQLVFEQKLLVSSKMLIQLVVL